MIRTVVWNENVHEQQSQVVRDTYPEGIHGCIAQALNSSEQISASTATLQHESHGLTAERLAETDVLLWWGHAAHGDVSDDVCDMVCDAVLSGMGIIFLHSAHFAKPFKKLLGTSCNLTWREAGERERLWTTAPKHPILAGVPTHFELENEEMYGEPFGVPEPLETVLISWFEGGEAFRSGLTYKRGAGNVFYFRPGHETYPTFHNDVVQRILTNAVIWAHNPQPRVPDVHAAPNVPIEQALEPLTQRGAKLHKDGEDGFR